MLYCFWTKRILRLPKKNTGLLLRLLLRSTDVLLISAQVATEGTDWYWHEMRLATEGSEKKLGFFRTFSNEGTKNSFLLLNIRNSDIEIILFLIIDYVIENVHVEKLYIFRHTLKLFLFNQKEYKTIYMTIKRKFYRVDKNAQSDLSHSIIKKYFIYFKIKFIATHFFIQVVENIK